MVTRYTQFLYKSIVIYLFLLLVIFSLTIESKAQNQLNPQYLNCWPSSQNFDTCYTVSIDSMIIQHMGCNVKIHYHRRVCFNGNESFVHIEMNRIVVEETSPPCGLINYIYNSSPAPIGSINEENFREVVTDLYLKLADSLIMNPWKEIPQEDRLYSMIACDENGLNFRYTFQAFEGTCMAYCAVQYGVFGGDFQWRTFWEYRWNKCANTCCELKINYCWDGFANPPRWRRKVERNVIGPDSLENPCNQYSPILSCEPTFSYQDIYKLFTGTCKETCGTIDRDDEIFENE